MNPSRIVVVGASLAGLRAVETARREGFAGSLTLLGGEDVLPYDRPPLSKELIDGSGSISVPYFAGVHDLSDRLSVDLRLGTWAIAVVPDERRVELGNGESLEYDALVVATGASARTLPGIDHLRGVHTLRTATDAHVIREALDSGARTVVIGAGFIGSEVASAARKRGLEVTMVEALPTPLVRAVGQTAGAALSALHLRYGTDLRVNASVARVEGTDHVTGVRMSDGEVIPADLVIVGIGATPSTQWLQSSGLLIDDGLVADENLRAAPSIWAAGDVARWSSTDFGRLLRLEHWSNAGDQGAHVMRNVLAVSPSPYRHIPYFWSEWYGNWIQFAGLPVGEPTVVAGGWDEPAFTALYREKDRLIGVLTLNRRGDIMKYRAKIASRTSWDDALAFAATRTPTNVPTP